MSDHEIINKAVCNLLIPFVFERSDWEKIENCNGQSSKEIVNEIKNNGNYGSLEWFSCCFRNLPVNETLTMRESPLLNSNSGMLVKRIEAAQPVREQLGFPQKENRPCYIGKYNIEFRFRKIRLLFFKMGIGMIHLETESKGLLPGELLDFNKQLGAIHEKVGFSYEKKVDKDHAETVRDSIYNLIRNVLEVQNYIQLKPYEKETFLTAYLLEYLVGNIGPDNKPQLFEMLRNRRSSNMRSPEMIAPENVYIPFDYISWVTGDKTLICFGDMSICGEDNRGFLTGPDGLASSINLNYITIYAYLIALKLSYRDAGSRGDQELEKMLPLLPKERLSAEQHINRLFEGYVRPALRLDDNIEKAVWDRREGLDEKISALSSQMDRMGDNLSEGIRGLSEKTDYLVNKVDLLVSFTENELKTFLEKERKKIRDTQDADHEEQVGEFISHTASYIDERVRLSGDEIVRKEREGLQILFGESWDELLSSSQTSLVSAGALLKRCSDISTPDFDFSGICICATAALEAELKHVFFDGLLNYMVKTYGDPETAGAEKVIKYWPEELLIISNDRSGKGRKKIRKADLFTMGKLPYLFGEITKLSDEPGKQAKQLKQAEMMKSRMSEYLAEIVLDRCKAMPYESFYRKSGDKDSCTCQDGCFVGKCEQIRKDYRNKAAHAGVMSGEEASSCYERVVTKPDTYVYNAKIAGVILELFSMVDGSKLRENFSCGPKTGSGDVKGGRPSEYSIGQEVELTDLELTSKGVLRGTIAGSKVGASLSRKHLKEKKINPKKYLGKKIEVRLYRWDENAQKFNAEFIPTERNGN